MAKFFNAASSLPADRLLCIVSRRAQGPGELSSLCVLTLVWTRDSAADLWASDGRFSRQPPTIEYRRRTDPGIIRIVVIAKECRSCPD